MTTPAEVGKSNILSHKLIDDWHPTWGVKGSLIHIIDEQLDQSKTKAERALVRRYIFGFLFHEMLGEKAGIPLSSKVLPNAAWYALQSWIEPVKDEETGQWRSNNVNFEREVAILAREAQASQQRAAEREKEILENLGFF